MEKTLPLGLTSGIYVGLLDGLKTLQAFKVNYQLRTVFAKNDLPSFLGGLEH